MASLCSSSKDLAGAAVTLTESAAAESVAEGAAVSTATVSAANEGAVAVSAAAEGTGGRGGGGGGGRDRGRGGRQGFLCSGDCNHTSRSSSVSNCFELYWPNSVPNTNRR